MLHFCAVKAFYLLLCLASCCFCSFLTAALATSARVCSQAPHYWSDFEAHEFYVGLGQIDYNAEEGSYEITLKVFTDDLELALEGAFGEALRLDDMSLASHHDSLVLRYVSMHFHFGESPNKLMKVETLGRETELDITWIYLVVQAAKPLGHVYVHNSMMMEVYREQSHVIHLHQAGERYSTLLHRRRKSDTIQT